MPAPIPPKPSSNAKEKPDLDKDSTVVEGPPEESFDEMYNKRLEFPLSLVSAILIHVFVGAMIVFVLFYLINIGDDKSGVPVKLVNLAGMDDAGEGSAGSGGEEDPFIKADGDATKFLQESLLDPTKLPDVNEVKQTIKYLDPTGNLPISDANAAAYAGLEESVRKKLLGTRQGAGPEKGSGFDGSKGKGPGGTGADSTFGRNMRWVLRFKVRDGQDYLDQLRSMGAEILVPIPDSDKCILIADISKPDVQKTASDDDMRRLADKIKFSDSRPEAVRSVSRTLHLDFSPKSFWAFFPKKIEDELSSKETNYRNRRAEDIEETIFRVAIRGGSYELVVDEQKIKR